MSGRARASLPGAAGAAPLRPGTSRLRPGPARSRPSVAGPWPRSGLSLTASPRARAWRGPSRARRRATSVENRRFSWTTHAQRWTSGCTGGLRHRACEHRRPGEAPAHLPLHAGGPLPRGEERYSMASVIGGEAPFIGSLTELIELNWSTVDALAAALSRMSRPGDKSRLARLPSRSRASPRGARRPGPRARRAAGGAPSDPS